jgi:hypothetical protein
MLTSTWIVLQFAGNGVKKYLADCEACLKIQVQSDKLDGTAEFLQVRWFLGVAKSSKAYVTVDPVRSVTFRGGWTAEAVCARRDSRTGRC